MLVHDSQEVWLPTHRKYRMSEGPSYCEAKGNVAVKDLLVAPSKANISNNAPNALLVQNSMDKQQYEWVVLSNEQQLS